MNLKEIVEKLHKENNENRIKDFVSRINFRLRFNYLRDIIYHIDIFMGEKNYIYAEMFLQAGDKIARYLELGHDSHNTKDIRSLKIITWKKWAKFYESQGNYPKALEHYRNIIKKIKLPEEENFMAEILMEMGIIEDIQGDKKEALKKFLKSSGIYKRKEEDFNFKASMFNCAHVLYDMNYYDKAKEMCHKIISLEPNETHIKSPVANAYLELANIAEVEDNREESRNYYRRALDAYRILKDRLKESDILNRLGSFEMEDKNYDTASRIYTSSLDIKKTVDKYQAKARFYMAFADVLRDGGNYESALTYYNLAFKFFGEASVESPRKVIKHRIYKILQKMGLVKKDLGTFMEKFNPVYNETSLSSQVQSIDYREFNGDGYIFRVSEKWEVPDSYRVGEKFFMFLLKNLIKVYMNLREEKEYNKYIELKRIMEKRYFGARKSQS